MIFIITTSINKVNIIPQARSLLTASFSGLNESSELGQEDVEKSSEISSEISE